VTSATPEQSEKAINLYKGQRSILTLVIASSGRGKTTAARNLPPESTHFINVLGKALPFPNAVKYTDGENMTVSSDSAAIRRAMKEASTDETCKYLVIDDAQYVMAIEFMDKAMQKGYDKFTIMARNFWDIMLASLSLRSDLKVFLLTHEDDSITGVRKMKTLGKLLDEKMTPEGLSSIVLYGEVEVVEGKKRRYYLSTQTDGITNAKSPLGMFPTEIPNDLILIANRIDEYYGGVELKDSALDFEIASV
jgi:hypothetical protein